MTKEQMLEEAEFYEGQVFALLAFAAERGGEVRKAMLLEAAPMILAAEFLRAGKFAAQQTTTPRKGSKPGRRQP